MCSLNVFLTPMSFENSLIACHFFTYASTRSVLPGWDHRSWNSCTNEERSGEAAHTHAHISLVGVIDNAIMAREGARLHHIVPNMSVELSLAGETQMAMRVWRHFEILREQGQQFDLCLRVTYWLPLSEPLASSEFWRPQFPRTPYTRWSMHANFTTESGPSVCLVRSERPSYHQVKGDACTVS